MQIVQNILSPVLQGLGSQTGDNSKDVTAGDSAGQFAGMMDAADDSPSKDIAGLVGPDAQTSVADTYTAELGAAAWAAPQMADRAAPNEEFARLAALIEGTSQAALVRESLGGRHATNLPLETAAHGRPAAMPLPMGFAPSLTSLADMDSDALQRIASQVTGDVKGDSLAQREAALEAAGAAKGGLGAEITKQTLPMNEAAGSAPRSPHMADIAARPAVISPTSLTQQGGSLVNYAGYGLGTQQFDAAKGSMRPNQMLPTAQLDANPDDQIAEGPRGHKVTLPHGMLQFAPSLYSAPEMRGQNLGFDVPPALAPSAESAAPKVAATPLGAGQTVPVQHVANAPILGLADASSTSADVQSLMGDGQMPLLSGADARLGSSNFVTGALPLGVPVSASAAALGAQLMPLVQAAQSGPVELVLSPAELGQLRFEILQRGDQVQIVLSAERPETMDLLRRNGDQLLADFRNAGFAGASLNFGQWGGGQEGRSPNFEDDPAERQSQNAPTLAQSAATFARPLSYLDPTRSLNLRL